MQEQVMSDSENMDFQTKLNKNKIYLLSLIFIIGLILRFYNINFEDLWFDEQSSFLIADPALSHKETILKSKNLDSGTGIVFNLILKGYFNVFGYNPDIGRILTAVFGVIAIPALTYLNFKITKNYGFIFVAFLSSISWYLISYSQELRLYSFLFLLSILSIIFFFRILEISEKKIINFNYILYILISSLAATTHIFFFIILFSQFIYLVLNKSQIKEKFYIKLFCILIIPIIYLIIMYDFLILQMSINDFWIKQVELDFFVNFFFSRFFGSKIMGTIYLIILIYLIFINRKIVFNISSKYFFLFLILFFSYFLPLIYSLFKQPILTDRYIIFVLIPIFILISSLIFEIKSLKKKFVLIFIILTSTLANNYIEIFQREISKPEFKKTINYIIKSETEKNLFVLAEHKIHQEIVSNYTKNLLSHKNEIFKISDNINGENFKNVWLLCYKPLNQFNCSHSDIEILKLKKKDHVNYKLISATLYEKAF